MEKPSAPMRDLARRLLTASRAACQPDEHEATRVCDTLRIPLTRFAGADGFTSLLRRALALGSAEVAVLRTITVAHDGHLEGLEQLPSNKANEAAVALTSNLLLLLVTFIGESITMQLVQEAWPEVPLHRK